MTNESSNSNLERVLNLLETFASNDIEMNVTEISQAFDITKTTALKMARLLEAHNFLEKNPATAKYRIGYKIYELGKKYHIHFPFLQFAEPYVIAMHNKWKIKINVSVLKPPCSTVIIMTRDSTTIPKMYMGFILPTHASAAGKLLLANLPEEKLQNFMKYISFFQLTPNTITNENDFLRHLETIRASGYSIENEEEIPGRACVAAPIKNTMGNTIASVSFSTSKDMLEKHMDELINDAVQMGRNISYTLGYVRPSNNII